MQRERRLTKGETPEAPTKKLSTSLAESALTFEDREAARLAGFDLGYAQRVETEIEDQVHARLHQLSLEALGMARRSAERTGPAWAAMIAWAGERE